MFKNQFLVAIRNLLRRKSNTFINIVGLAIGIGSCLLISLYVKNELSYDKHFLHQENIYKLILEKKIAGQSEIIPIIPHSFVTTAASEIAEIEKGTCISGPFNDMLVTYQLSTPVRLLETDVYAADSNFFDVLSFKILKGDIHTMLNKPFSMVLTASTAKKYFGDIDPIGKTINMSRDDYMITGICEDVPENSHFKFNMLISINSIERFGLNNFSRPDTHTYFRLQPNVNISDVDLKFKKLVDTYASAEIESLNKVSWEAFKKSGNDYHYFLRPLSSIYLDPANLGGMKPGGNGIYVNVLIIVAILVLIIACINFINLTTARSQERAKEIGVRKIMGSSRRQLIFQFLVESFLLSTCGVAIAVLIVYQAMPYFNTLTNSHLHLTLGFIQILILFGAILAVTFLAGFYPSLVLSVTTQLKGNVFNHSGRGKWFRNGLVIFQFWVSITLTICVLVMQKQMNYLSEKNLGFTQDHLLVIEGDFHTKPDLTRTMVTEMERMPEVISASGGMSMPSFGGIWEKQYKSDTDSEVLNAQTMYLGDGFLETMQTKLVSGKYFSPTESDTSSVILNEAAVKAFELTDPIGHQITYIEQTYGTGQQTTYKVIGVVQDFHYATLHEKIMPLVIQSNEIIMGRMRYMIARIKAGSPLIATAKIENKWKELSPEIPSKIRYAETVINDYYQSEQRSEQVFRIFAGLSIFVACIGLFALSSYTSNLRSKEIAIRKVIGASVNELTFMLSKDFFLLITLSLILAAPVAWYIMEFWWLRNFAFKVNFDSSVVLLTGIWAFSLALLTVSYQIIKVALKNPITALNHDE